MKIFNVIFLILICHGLTAQIYLDIDVSQSKDTIEANIDNPNFTILDVRTADEYLPEHIEGAFYRDFYAEDFALQLDSLDKSRVYLIHCRSGNRSGQTITLMEELGFQTVYNMLGGMIAWNTANYPVTDVIPEFVDIYANTTSTKEIDLVEISVYPNPSNNYIFIELSTNEIIDLTYKVISVSGSLELVGDFNNSFHVDLSTVKNGHYSLLIFDGEELINTSKIFKF